MDKLRGIILKCVCEHEFQAEVYGKVMRVFTPTAKGYRCTVCLREVVAGSDYSPPKLGD